MQAATVRYHATLRVPYAAFPVAVGEDAYDVEARVRILRAETRNRVSELAQGQTTFRVYSSPEPEAEAPPPPELPPEGDGQPPAETPPAR